MKSISSKNLLSSGTSSVLGREVHIVINLAEELPSLGLTHKAVLLVILGDVAIDPLAMCDV